MISLRTWRQPLVATFAEVWSCYSATKIINLSERFVVRRIATGRWKPYRLQSPDFPHGVNVMNIERLLACVLWPFALGCAADQIGGHDADVGTL